MSSPIEGGLSWFKGIQRGTCSLSAASRPEASTASASGDAFSLCVVPLPNMASMPSASSVKQNAKHYMSVASDKAKLASANVGRGETMVSLVHACFYESVGTLASYGAFYECLRLQYGKAASAGPSLLFSC